MRRLTVKTAVLSHLLSMALPLWGQQALSERVRDLAAQITTTVTKEEKQRLAVLPFRNLDGQPTIFGIYLADSLVTHLFQTGDFRIVERQLLDRILSELRVERSGAIDSVTAKEIGRIAAVDAIVTGSITELENLVAVNCRLIDATTGEVFGAAQTTIPKDADVAKIMTTVISQRSAATDAGTGVLATRDVGTLRVSLKSVVPTTRTRGGRTMNGLRWTFDFNNREARRTMFVGLNAEGQESRGSGLRIVSYSSANATPLRSSVLDDRGNLWRLSSDGLGGIGFVQAGVHGRNGREAYDPIDIVKLLRLRDEIGRDTDDPSDGRTTNATSTGEGGSNITFGGGRVTSPRRFVAFKGNRFISGSTVEIGPGQSLVVTMDFHPDSPLASSTFTSNTFQFSSEIVVGAGEAGARRTYALHTLAFDGVRVSAP